MSDLVAYARDLEAEDASLAKAISDLETLRSAAGELRARAEGAVAFLGRLPEARTAADAALEQAVTELRQRLAEAQEAEAQLERAGKEEAVLAARRAVVRTRDAAAGAERKVERLRAERAALESAAQAVREEVPELVRRAAEVAARLDGIARAPHVGEPGADAAGVAAWGSRVEGSLFVARSGLETERERVVRQADELATAALGESFASVSRVRERLERLS